MFCKFSPLPPNFGNVRDLSDLLHVSTGIERVYTSLTIISNNDCKINRYVRRLPTVINETVYIYAINLFDHLAYNSALGK